MRKSIINSYLSSHHYIHFYISSSLKGIYFYLTDERYRKILPDLIFFSITKTEIEIEYDHDICIFIDYRKPEIEKSREDYWRDFDQSEMDIVSKCSSLEKDAKYITSKLRHFAGLHKRFYVSVEKHPDRGFMSYIKYDNIKKWSWIVSLAYNKGKPIKIKLDLQNEWILDIKNVNKFDDILYEVSRLCRIFTNFTNYINAIFKKVVVIKLN